jgi:hypothetical protein
MLPLAIIGLALLVTKRHWSALIILLAVPVYFFCVQSIVHTEYRYVLAVNYFLFGLVGVTISWVGSLSLSLWERVRVRAYRSVHPN